MSSDWQDELRRLRPEITAQRLRLQSTVANAMSVYRSGGDVAPYVEALAQGEVHPALGLDVGRDFLTDALVAAWELAATRRTLEEVHEMVASRLGDPSFPLPLYVSDVPKALGLLSYVSTVAALILDWDSDPADPAAKARLAAWVRFPVEAAPKEIFSAYAEDMNVPEVVVIRAGLTVLAWLEQLTWESLDVSLLLEP